MGEPHHAVFSTRMFIFCKKPFVVTTRYYTSLRLAEYKQQQTPSNRGFKDYSCKSVGSVINPILAIPALAAMLMARATCS